MKIPLWKADIQEDIRNKCLTSIQFKEDVILQNVQRGKLLALVVICFETIFVIIDLVSCLLHVNDAFAYASYLIMYSLLIAFNLLYLFVIHRYEQDKISLEALGRYAVLYLTLVMTWGSVISLLDQKMYGHLMSFMVNMIVCSIIYLFDAKRMSIPYLTSALILAIGLPFFQQSSNVLIGHYVNLLCFAGISWTASRIVYRNYCDNYVIKELMKESKVLLEQETEKNRIINQMLSIANAQLRRLALVDELTGLSNRRSFRNYLERMFETGDSDRDVSVIMIDIDNFKQYNDTFGHKMGDQALISVARQINSMVESNDQAAIRWGGEEFLYVAFHQSKERSLEIANVLRLNILQLKIPASSSIGPYLTISLGVCSGTVTSAAMINEMITTADRALYQAKNNGRNRVAAFEFHEQLDG